MVAQVRSHLGRQLPEARRTSRSFPRDGCSGWFIANTRHFNSHASGTNCGPDWAVCGIAEVWQIGEKADGRLPAVSLRRGVATLSEAANLSNTALGLIAPCVWFDRTLGSRTLPT
jgi:hypothetical protein